MPVHRWVGGGAMSCRPCPTCVMGIRRVVMALFTALFLNPTRQAGTHAHLSQDRPRQPVAVPGPKNAAACLTGSYPACASSLHISSPRTLQHWGSAIPGQWGNGPDASRSFIH